MEAKAAAQVVGDSGERGGVELFYEDIEAPKFVDFTAADHYNPDDRYWFCARVGCDQRHEQEMDLEEINKNFVLRVMAARSPYVKFRRTVAEKTITSSTTARKCPLTAPSKHSRPRLVVLSSIRSANPVTTVTPRVKKSCAANSNALTTPRCRNKVVKPELFRSVRNPKKREETAVVSSEEEQTNRIVRKALVFSLPKMKKKALVEPTTDDASVGKICKGVKKLDINGGQSLQPPSNVCGASSRKKMGARDVKSRVYDALKPQTCKKGKENDSLLKKKQHLEEKQEEETEGFHGSSDMEVDENSNRRSSVETSELFEVPIVQDCIDDLRNKLPIQVEQLLPNWDVEGEDGNNFTADDRQDDKENTSAVDHNREQNTESERSILGKQHGKSQKGRIISKEATADVKSGHGGGGKYSKPKPTNPKPFRLRTDERRVLKEANLEKKLLLTPLKEMNSVAVAAVISSGSSSLHKKKGVSSQERVKRTKQQALITPSRNTNKRQLSVIKETAAVNLKIAAPMKKNSEEIANKSAAEAAASRGRIHRRTIPRETNFHTVSVPKTCCTKKWV